MFSRRTAWEASANELAELLNSIRAAGRGVVDLTVSNPTTCGFPFPRDLILKALSSRDILSYRPDPRGMPSAREAVVSYYRDRRRVVSSEDLFITASTSESYSLLFKLLCDPGDAVLVPRPSYPLFDYLSEINDVRTIPYRLTYDGSWKIDTDSVRKGLGQSARAVILMDPHNPTGSFIADRTWREIAGDASAGGAALIVDEVFTDYRFGRTAASGGTGGGPPISDEDGSGERFGHDGPLTFILNGLSKTAALPQMKLGWMVVAGDSGLSREARTRLEILNDTFLSVNTPAQVALHQLLAAGGIVRPGILDRVTRNYSTLRRIMENGHGCTVLDCDGGWNAVVRLPDGISDTDCALGLLRDEGVYCYPGYFFDFEEENLVVLSLLPAHEDFDAGVTALARWTGRREAGPVGG